MKLTSPAGMSLSDLMHQPEGGLVSTLGLLPLLKDSLLRGPCLSPESPREAGLCEEQGCWYEPFLLLPHIPEMCMDILILNLSWKNGG